MPRVAYEALMSRTYFENPGRCLGLVRQMLGAIRAQMASKRSEHVQLSLLVKLDDLPERPADDDRLPAAKGQSK